MTVEFYVTLFGMFSWQGQAQQYPRTGDPGISYFRGDVPGHGLGYVDCLLYRNADGELVGILNHFPADMPPYEDKGNVTLLVRPDHQRQGIGSRLWAEAVERYGVKFEGQSFTEDGAHFATTVTLRQAQG
ncbi:hypothetical protein GCM10029976_090730 [Kribbella albertanoniae]|uniref:N-acetyltransferase n=1 Tax=Kribbella albertanoniae TaxID=1266829 RepID=A0A4R4PJN0_9ACTN|nr:GNAT family N-acetyltransferase [Kribbella albertanoniae]TDC22143.1 N-acetyltransferase [Kribbella albertanoniae]